MEIRSLKDIATAIRTGKTPPTKEEKYFNGKINWYSPGDLDKTKYLLDAKRTITNEAIEDKKAITFPKDTLLIGCIGDIGKLGITSEVSSSNQQITGILPNDQTNVSYLFYWFKGNKKVLENYSNNAVVPILNNRTLETVKIPLPPLDQQKKIAAILDAADAYRQKTKVLIEKYDELTQSLFLDMFGDPVTNPKGWDTTAIKEVCTLQGGYSFKSKDFVNEGVKLVKIANVHFEDMVWDEVDLLPSDFLDKYSKFSLNEGDILMALTRPIIKSLGTVKAITVDQSDLPCLLNQRVARFIPNEKRLHKSYLLRYIFGSYFKNKIERYSSTSLQPNVSNKQIEEIEIMLPPIEFQTQFAERVQAIEAQKAQAEASLAGTEDLFNSLLQRAFKGELTS